MNRKTDSGEWIGLALALLCGVVLGSAVAVARFAYEGGASGIVVALARATFMSVVLGLGLRFAGFSLHLPRELLPMAVLNGSLMALMTFGNIGAVEFISVGLAALLFFTFPIMIALLVLVLRIERLSAAKIACVVLAFIGLGVMLGVSVGTVDWRGTGLSLMGAFATAVNALLVARFFGRVNVFVVTFYFSLVSVAVLFVLALTVAPVSFPTSMSGWGGILGVALFQTIGTPMYLYAIKKIGALKTAMATNIQPVISIAEAWLLFGEILTLLQALGGAIVLAAIALMQWFDLRRRPGTGPD